MSYLSFPCINFSGMFTADPSTINNYPNNYGEEASAAKGGVGPTDQVQLSWNPYGAGVWSIPSATVESYVMEDGTVITRESHPDDPMFNLILENTASILGSPSKLVDLDTDEQTRTKLFGMYLQLRPNEENSAALLTFYFDQRGALKRLWFGRNESLKYDTAAGGVFQSIAPADQQLQTFVNGTTLGQENPTLQWNDDLSDYPILGKLQAQAKDGLSINLNTYAFQGSHASPNFQNGKMTMALGPYSSNEPKYQVPNGRMLTPFIDRPLPSVGKLHQLATHGKYQPFFTPNSYLWNAPATVFEANGDHWLSLDLGNSLLEYSPTNNPANVDTADVGDMYLATIPPQPDKGSKENPKAIGKLCIPVPYKPNPKDKKALNLNQTAGIFRVKLTSDQYQELQETPLAIIMSQDKHKNPNHFDLRYATDAKQTIYHIGLIEPDDGVFITTDQASTYMNSPNPPSVESVPKDEPLEIKPPQPAPLNDPDQPEVDLGPTQVKLALYGFRFGQPITTSDAPKDGSPWWEEPIAISLLPPIASSPANANYPADALQIPEGSSDNKSPYKLGTVSLTNGVGTLDLKAQPLALQQLPTLRQSIGGEVYFLGGPWSVFNNANQQAPACLTVKLFEYQDLPLNPTWWNSAGSILYKYYYLYAVMAGKLDLSVYNKVKQGSQYVHARITLPFYHPAYMPVTRELSFDETYILKKWIENGCPPGEDPTSKSDEPSSL